MRRPSHGRHTRRCQAQDGPDDDLARAEGRKGRAGRGRRGGGVSGRGGTMVCVPARTRPPCLPLLAPPGADPERTRLPPRPPQATVYLAVAYTTPSLADASLAISVLIAALNIGVLVAYVGSLVHALHTPVTQMLDVGASRAGRGAADARSCAQNCVGLCPRPPSPVHGTGGCLRNCGAGGGWTVVGLGATCTAPPPSSCPGADDGCAGDPLPPTAQTWTAKCLARTWRTRRRACAPRSCASTGPRTTTAA